MKVVFAGTRQVYGRPDHLPVDESHLVRPIDVNGVNKAAGEYYHLLYNNVFGVRACSLRLTNVYGPRQLIRHNRQGFIGWFIRLAIEDREIQIFGDGSQMRDFVFVDDAADAFLRAGRVATPATATSSTSAALEPITHRDLVALLHRGGRHRARALRRRGRPRRKRIDIGSFYSDSTKFQRATGWTPRVDLREGCRRTIAFYREHLPHYVEAGVIPFLELKPGEDAADVRAAIERVIDARLVRARARARGLRDGVRRGRAARRTPSASAPAPTRSRSRCARWASARATRSSPRRCRPRTRRWRS